MKASDPATLKPIVFYDGGCPMCRREIDHYRRIDRRENIRWIDIIEEPHRLSEYGLSREQAMQRFHVLDNDGNWQTGARGFIEVWRQLPYYHRLASAVQALRLAGPMDFVYRYWARWHWRRRCNQEQCGLNSD